MALLSFYVYPRTHTKQQSVLVKGAVRSISLVARYDQYAVWHVYGGMVSTAPRHAQYMPTLFYVVRVVKEPVKGAQWEYGHAEIIASVESIDGQWRKAKAQAIAQAHALARDEQGDV